MKTSLIFSATLLMFCLAPFCVYGDAIQNGGFELGTGADADNWNEIEITNGGGAIPIADRDSSNPNAGMQAMFLSVSGVQGDGPVAEIQQQTAVGSVVAGTTYDFNFLSQRMDGPGSVGFYEVLWFDGDGSNGGGVQGSATGLQTYGVSATYVANGQTGLVAPTGADSVLVQIRLVTGAFDGASGSAFIDDVSFTAQAIPEPATSLAILGFGLIGFARRNRR